MVKFECVLFATTLFSFTLLHPNSMAIYPPLNGFLQSKYTYIHVHIHIYIIISIVNLNDTSN